MATVDSHIYLGGAKVASTLDTSTGINTINTVATGGATYTGPLANQLPASLGAKTSAASLSITPASDAAFAVAGTQARTAAITANPVLAGARGSGTAPAAVTAGQLVDIWAGLSGNIFTSLTSTSGSNIAYVNLIGATFSPSQSGLASMACAYAFDGSNEARLTTVSAASATGADSFATAPVPHSAATGAIVPIVASAVSSLVLKAAAGNFYSASMTAGLTAGFLILYNATAAPTNGTTLTAGLILAVVPVSANGYATLGSNPVPDRCTVGAVLLFSTSTTTYTAPVNLALHMRGCAV